jgi:ERCC4-type nuclease
MASSNRIVVDTNPGEDNVFAALVRELGDVVKRERLDVGDVHIKTEHGTIIVERKRWNDLQSSLNDQRYSEQKLRLLAQRELDPSGKTHIVVLIESKNVPFFDGESNNRKNKPSFCALSKMTVRDKISVLWSASSEDAGQQIAYLYSALCKNGFDAAEKIKTVAASGYAGVAKHSNKRKNADDSMFELMLCNVTGVSGTKACSIAKEYGSMSKLVNAYDNLKNAGATDAELDEMLSDVKVGDKRIGPALSHKIRVAIFGSS